jgi:plastocyanin domain-containing protein
MKHQEPETKNEIIGLETVNTINTINTIVERDKKIKRDSELKTIKDALKWNVIKFIDIICSKTNKERLALLDPYRKKINRDLIDDIESEFSFNFKKTLLALFQDPTTYDCFSLYDSVKGIGTNEDTIIEIIATRSNSELEQIKQKYIELQ